MMGQVQEDLERARAMENTARQLREATVERAAGIAFKALTDLTDSVSGTYPNNKHGGDFQRFLTNVDCVKVYIAQAFEPKIPHEITATWSTIAEETPSVEWQT